MAPCQRQQPDEVLTQLRISFCQRATDGNVAMINCDFKVDLFGHRMIDVLKGFGRGMAQWLWDLRQGDLTD